MTAHYMPWLDQAAEQCANSGTRILLVYLYLGWTANLIPVTTFVSKASTGMYSEISLIRKTQQVKREAVVNPIS